MAKKITVVGAGHVGGQAAFCMALKGLGDIYLLDIRKDWAKGTALDIQEAMPAQNLDINITGGDSYPATKNSDIVIITAGFARKPGMSRDDLTKANAKVIRAIVPKIVKYSPKCKLIMVTNPVDTMTSLAYELSAFPKKRVLGIGGMLDTLRFRSFIAQETESKMKDIKALVMGGHGDLMVPLISRCRIRGKDISSVLSAKKINSVVKSVRYAGGEILGLLKEASSFFAPGAAIALTAETVLKDKKTILPSSVLLEGEYGINGVFMGAPAKLGKKGVEKVPELKLSDKEKAALQRSAEAIKALNARVLK